jgi:NADPH-dependent 2,4-dienoyl-CoA reductase/sulfur reductase-like enzyme
MGSSVSKAELQKRHVVIVGGGYGGIELASCLLKMEMPFTLIDPKEYFQHKVASLRAAVNPGMFLRGQIFGQKGIIVFLLFE